MVLSYSRKRVSRGHSTDSALDSCFGRNDNQVKIEIEFDQFQETLALIAREDSTHAKKIEGEK